VSSTVTQADSRAPIPNPVAGSRASKRDDLVAVVHERTDARVPLVLTVGFDIASSDAFLDVEGTHAVLTRSSVGFNGGEECMVRVGFITEFGNPLCPCSIEDQFDLVVVFVTLLDCLQGVDDTAEIGFGVCTSEHDDSNLIHTESCNRGLHTRVVPFCTVDAQPDGGKDGY